MLRLFVSTRVYCHFMDIRILSLSSYNTVERHLVQTKCVIVWTVHDSSQTQLFRRLFCASLFASMASWARGLKTFTPGPASQSIYPSWRWASCPVLEGVQAENVWHSNGKAYLSLVQVRLAKFILTQRALPHRIPASCLLSHARVFISKSLTNTVLKVWVVRLMNSSRYGAWQP